MFCIRKRAVEGRYLKYSRVVGNNTKKINYLNQSRKNEVTATLKNLH